MLLAQELPCGAGGAAVQWLALNHRRYGNARHGTGFAAAALIEGPHLRADDPPFELVNSDLSMDWSRVTDNDPAERWLRSKIIEFMGEPGA